LKLQKKFKIMKENEVRFEEYRTDDAEVIVTAFGLCSRIAKKTVDIGRDMGIKLGLFRPISLWPYPYQQLENIASRDFVKFFISLEMNAGQMVEDVKLAVCGKKPVHFYGRMGGIVPTPEEFFTEIKQHLEKGDLR
jgi:2-oxoglutarate ferredoxin oxidoreductase subunit alpha